MGIVSGNIREENQRGDQVPCYVRWEEIEEAAAHTLVSGVSHIELYHSPTGMVE